MATTPPKRAYDFSIQVPIHRPRAWERLPKTALATRHRGRKVWKRYELRSKEKTGTRENPISIAEDDGKKLAGEGLSPARPVKRRRNGNGAEGEESGPGKEGATEGREVGYIATMRSEAPGTPKRKFAKRKSLKPDLFRRAVTKAQESPRKLRGSSPVKLLRDCVRVEVQPLEDRESTEDRMQSPSRSAFEIIDEEPSRSAFESEVREDVFQARAGPSEEDVEEALKSVSPVSDEESREDRDWEDVKDDGGSSIIHKAATDESGRRSPRVINEPEQPPAIGNTPDDVEADQDNEKLELHQNSVTVEGPTSGTLYTDRIVIEKDYEEDSVEYETLKPEPPHSSEESANDGHTAAAEVSLGHEVLLSLCVNTVCDHNQASPISGDKGPLCRNESPSSPTTEDNNGPLPYNESPSTPITEDNGPPLNNESPSGLRDAKSTMASEPPSQEEQQNPEPELVGEDEDAETIMSDFDIIQNEDLELSDTTDYAPQLLVDADDAEFDKITKTGESLRDAISPENDSAVLLVDSVPNLQTDELSASPQRQSPRPVVKLPSCTNSPIQDSQFKMDHMPDSGDAPVELPTRTTRSGARFSDDTNLLKDFLSRAQARKLAKDGKIPAMGPTATSPRRSPRKVLAEKDSNSPSPQKPSDLASRPGTPPGKQRLDAFSLDDVDELTAEPTSCRRSNRTRLPSTPKVVAGAPSFIPVRRADGTDPVILQKSIAQELAVQTRANTRRNKGQSKPPSVALQTLTVETTESVANRVRARATCKSVGWDEKLVYYQRVNEVAVAEEEGKEEKRPKVRRLRGLGATNGTPAPKRVVDSNVSQGTPAPRRRGKM